MKEKICLITGATDGIGKATALRLAAEGYKVVVVARNPDKVESLFKEIISAYPAASLDYLLADLSSLNQVCDMLQIFKRRYERLDVLINNAGVVMAEKKITEDGFETTFQVNYLAAFIITNSLLHQLMKSDQGRIVNVTSNVYTMGKFDVANIRGEKRYNAITTYAASKLYLLMFTESLAEKVKGSLTVNSLHPGIVRTNMSTNVKHMPFIFKVISFIALPFAITPEKSADTPVFLATSDSVRDISGKYFVHSRMVKTRSKFDTPENREKLWQLSIDLSEMADRELSPYQH